MFEHRANKSPVWVYFDVVEANEKFVKCRLCEGQFSRGGVGKMASTTPMFNHLKKIHPTEYSQLGLKASRGSVTTGTGPPMVNLPHNHVPDMHAIARARCRSVLMESEYPGDPIYPPGSLAPPLDSSIDPAGVLCPAEVIPLLQDPQSMLQLEHSDGENEIAEDSQPSSTPVKIPPPKKSPNKSTSSSTTTTTAVLNPPSSPESEMCLRWNSHHANMSTVIPALMDDERYVDVTLVAEGNFIKCHKLILSSCSNYFDEMLQHTNSSQQTIIFLRDIQHWQMRALVDFMYKGEVNVDQSKLEALLKAAEDLQIKGLAGNTPKKEPEVHEPAPAVEKIEKVTLPEIKTEDEKYMDNILMEDDDDDEEYFPQPEKRGKYKKKDRKRKISAPPDPSQLKHVKINLRGTKSRPNIKQPKFFSPDYPEYDPDRCVSPPKLDSDPLFHIDNIKLEPIDIEVPKSPTFSEMNSMMDKSLSENSPQKKKAINVYTNTKISNENVEEKPSTSKDILENPCVEKIYLPGQKEVVINKKAIIVKCQNVKKLIDENSSIQKMLEAATGKQTLSESDKAKLPQIRVRNLPTTETMLKKFATTQLTSILKKGEAGPAPKHIILKKVSGSTKPTILRHSLPAKTKEFTTEVQDTEDIAEKISLLAKTRKELNKTSDGTTVKEETTVEETSATITIEKQTSEESTG